MRLVEFLRLTEKYSRNNRALLQYMKDRPLDPYPFWDEFVSWYEEFYSESLDELLDQMDLVRYGVDAKAFSEQPEYYYDLPEEIREDFDEHIREYFMSGLVQHDPAHAPTWAHMDLNQPKLLNRQTWLIHFSDHAYEIAQNGFRYGIDRMDQLGLTKYFGDDSKEQGGYNFAFRADSRYAINAVNNERYGRHAVMFQNSGVEAYHYGDEEDQIIFHGEDVDPRNIILLMEEYGDWIVMPHPSKGWGGRDSQGEGIYKGDFERVVPWVMQNVRQYGRMITGW